MFASFAFFIKKCHTVNDVMNTPSSASATLAIVRKRVRPRITGTDTQIEKLGKVTWDDSLSMDATTITLYIIDH